MPSGILPGVGLTAVQDAAADFQRQKLQSEIDLAEVDKSNADRAAKLEKACQGFEAIFINTLLQEMRKTVPDDGLLPTSNAARTWQQLFDNQLAETLASRQEMGVAKMLYQQLQEGMSKKN